MRAEAEAEVSTLPGIGPGIAEKFSRLGVFTLLDLVLHLPARYQDRTRSVPLNALEVGRECLVTGRIEDAEVLMRSRGRSLIVTLRDDRGALRLRWFHFSRKQQESMRPGSWIRAYGGVRFGPNGPEMTHPEYRVHAAQPPDPEPTLTPVYPATAGLSATRIGNWAAAALERLQEMRGSVLPDERFPALFDALRFLHRPVPTEDGGLDEVGIAAARRRVALDELLGHYLLLKQRQSEHRSLTTDPLPSVRALGKELLAHLGFRLSAAQARVTTEILDDLSREVPMMRLLQGDVGSGKTVVAAFAMIRVAEHEAQTALMAPTEILAEQHYQTLCAWFEPLGLRVALLTGRQRAAERRANEAAIVGGGASVVVGTHALFQGGVAFHRLALAVIDEQHRFGVHQRMQLLDKGRLPHQLVMTATPIPRTLTMALYSNMDVSVIDELPPGRKPVRTRTLSDARRDRVIEHVAKVARAGRQVYWVCMLIEEDEEFPAHAAQATFEQLRSALSVRCALVHGRLPADEKAAAMAAFKAGEIDVLVATTVIEVGVDVPNATLMVIDNAERLGLAQLHQLRGRVGRGANDSTCMLLFTSPLSDVAKSRLQTMRETNDGFVIAERDLELRGPGDLLGTRQTGEQAFRVVDLGRDASLVPEVIRLGDQLLREDSTNAELILNTWTGGSRSYVDV